MPPKPHGGVKKKPWTRKCRFTKPRKLKDPLIEESDVSFAELVTGITNIQVTAGPWTQPDPRLDSPIDSHSSSINMLPGDHPLYEHLSKLFDDFRKLSSAVNSLKFSTTVAKCQLERVHGLLDTFDDTLGQMASIQTPQ